MTAQDSRSLNAARHAALIVSCQVSPRWLSFIPREQYEVLDEDLLHIDVMTRDDEGAPYKLCELILARGDLLRAVAAVGDPPFRTTPVRKTEAVADRKPARAPRKSARKS